jgi:hypothetical protein
MAYNGTGRPEAVSGPLTPGHLTAGFFGGDQGAISSARPGWGEDHRPMHIHLELDGREIGNAMVPYSAAAAGRYQLRNSGRATGAWGTGWKG